MTSNINKSILEYYEEKANTLSKDMWKLREISSNRYGLITGTVAAILGYHKYYTIVDGEAAMETIKEACAWIEWSGNIPQEKWLDYAAAREIPFKFRELWKKYKASGSTETFMTWLAAQ